MNDEELFVEGEKRLGWYTVELLRQTSTGWELSALPMHAIVTNYRLLLKPFRKKYPPAIIPRQVLQSVELITLDHYHPIAISFKTGQRLYIMVSSGSVEKMAEDMNTLMLPPPRFQFDENVPMTQIERLIQYFTEGIPPEEQD